LANIGQRIGAATIDSIAIIIYSVCMVYFLDDLGLFDTMSRGELTIIILCFLPVILYYPLLEFFLKGKTLGKALVKIKVAKVDGKRPSIGEILLRWLLRAIDTKTGILLYLISALFNEGPALNRYNEAIAGFMLFPIPVIGLIFIIVSKKNQRLGDFAANTIVIHQQKRISLEETILRSKSDNYVPVFKQALQLRDKDIYIIKKVVEKAEKEMDHTQVVPLANKAKNILKIETDMLPLQLLKTLLLDYNYLAQEKDLD